MSQSNGNGAWTDFISDFMSFTESAISSEIHRKWSAISCIAGALERRVWAPVGSSGLITYPNLYVILVAPPGSGKYIIQTVKDLWFSCCELGTTQPAFVVAPDSVSRASLIDDLAKAKSSRMTPDGILSYHSLLVASEEFEVLLPSYDPSFISVLNDIWNNKASHRETRRHGPARDVNIERPMFNILAGATPAYFTAHFPEEAWNTGLIRRIVMVYTAEAPLKDIFSALPEEGTTRDQLLNKLSQLSALYGPASWTLPALEKIRAWHMSGAQPKPTHSKLIYYTTSRTHHTIKLALISAVSRTGHLLIDQIDVTRAIHWLLEAESFMPDIFRAMAGKSDAQVIEELHYYMLELFRKNKQAPIQTSSINQFLSQRLPSEKVPHVIALAEGMNVIAKMAGTYDSWVPRPRHQHGVE